MNNELPLCPLCVRNQREYRERYPNMSPDFYGEPPDHLEIILYGRDNVRNKHVYAFWCNIHQTIKGLYPTKEQINKFFTTKKISRKITIDLDRFD